MRKTFNVFLYPPPQEHTYVHMNIHSKMDIHRGRYLMSITAFHIHSCACSPMCTHKYMNTLTYMNTHIIR